MIGAARPVRASCAWLLACLAYGCGTSTANVGTSTRDLPPPVDVCFEADDGSRVAARATPGRAGVYDPSLPIEPRELNWFVEGGPCVSYPGDATARARCGDRSAEAPIVTRVLCQQ